MASSSKRPRQEEEHDATNETRLESLDLISSDPLETPRPSRIRRGTNQDLGSPSLHEDSPSRASSGLSQSSTSNHSSVSHQSSAKRQRRNAGLQETGFKPVSFELDCDLQPESLRALCQQLTKIGDGSKIIPTELREMKLTLVQLIGANIPDGAYFDANDAHGLPQWRYPSLDLAQEIVTRAALCLDEGEGESSWNMDVHAPLLSWVFRQKRSRLVDYRYCTSAQILREFKPRNAPSKNVDFCVIIRPEEDSPAYEAIEDLCRLGRPGLAINHTEWGNFDKDPIAISIETKRHAENWDNAILQMGTWHSAQWRSLVWGRSQQPVRHIDFLPGIIIQGHSWLFVATIFKNNKARLYHSVAIGDTKTKFGIYKLTISLQCLQGWVEETYWPAFKADILEI
ncbi:hypothetical protein BGZ61DRAFT_372283 [Ilyonectria robusta]|uniref:uncharacterized protein n=1 Tax=Ilyonectria robusta TaxID=1079257 RepID=UPI001E8E813F|nr:uncharacterized protein BGZ61DRAFT_372283 [Ilyonectria robusta]KAH8656461.1 hypothetical protein BGZ61DRAFT_372283 [Ilyonectria robusta]